MKKRKRSRVLVLLILLGVALYLWQRSDDRRPAPDDRLAGHLTAMCGIAGDHVQSPRAGVDALFAYFGENSPDMLGELGALLVVIERIDDDAAHDRRALAAHDRLARPLKRCERTWMKFFEAVEADPEAARKLDRGVNRVARALDLLFNGKKAGALPLGLPSPLELVESARR